MRGRRVADVVRSVDVMPTVLDLLGIPVPSSVAGASLAARMTGATGEAELETYSETMYPRYHFGWSELRAVRARGFKLIAAPRPELYDLDERSLERSTTSISPGPRWPRPSLADCVPGNRMTDARAASARTIDPDARARLSALGYVGGSRDVVQPPHRSPRPEGQDRSLPIDHGRSPAGDRARRRRRAHEEFAAMRIAPHLAGTLSPAWPSRLDGSPAAAARALRSPRQSVTPAVAALSCQGQSAY